jgi:hypothetical protein
MMMPFSMRCNTCGNYIYIGTKFNMRLGIILIKILERVIEENYLGIAIFRFYLKCTSCHAECAFKTDP